MKKRNTIGDGEKSWDKGTRPLSHFRGTADASLCPKTVSRSLTLFRIYLSKLA